MLEACCHHLIRSLPDGSDKSPPPEVGAQLAEREDCFLLLQLLRPQLLPRPGPGPGSLLLLTPPNDQSFLEKICLCLQRTLNFQFPIDIIYTTIHCDFIVSFKLIIIIISFISCGRTCNYLIQMFSHWNNLVPGILIAQHCTVWLLWL